MDVGLVLEEVRFEDCDNKDEPVQAIRMRLRKRSGERDFEGQEQGWELELVAEHQHGNADNDTDRNSTGINCVVSHALEYDMGTTDSMKNGPETRPHQDDVGRTTGNTDGTLNSDTHISTRGERTSIAASPVIGQNVITNTKATVDLLSNGELISSDHLNLDTKGEGIFDILLSVFARWIKDGKKTNELNTLPSALLLSLSSSLCATAWAWRPRESGYMKIRASIV